MSSGAGSFARILVGVDGTEWGFEALRQALLLAADTASIRAVTALDTAPAIRTGLQAPHFAELLTQEAAEAQATAEAILDGRPGAEARVVRGKPVDVLRRERDELEATLVAIGGRRSSRFLGIVLGDTGTELLHDARCSLLLAYPAAESAWRPRRIVVGLDGSTYARDALELADEIAARLDGSVETVSATGGQKDADREADWAARVQTWDEADPVRALVDRSRSADLVVVGSRGLHGVRALGSVSERVAHQAHCTALVVHAPEP
ncbi:MAG TPA: universal stress protein [Gaiellaceae bacterium]|jgi:nucleotide-binding universal stress UspA family protein|nr:universal stress protein [Gaiellaceae bacterium]